MDYYEGFTQRNFAIRAVLGAKVTAGQINRSEKATKTSLGTERGVRAWILEQNPFVSISVVEIKTRKDITAQFAGDIEYCQSVHNQPPIVIKKGRRIS